MEVLRILCILAFSFVGEMMASRRPCKQEKDCDTFCPMGYYRDRRGCVLCGQCIKTGVFESDIIVTSKTYKNLEYEYEDNKQNSLKKRSVLDDPDKQWPRVGSVVEIPFIFTYMSSKMTNNVHAAMNEFHKKTCIRFVEKRQEKNFVDFRGRGACSSSVGMIGGRQLIRLGSGCQKLGTAIHEMMHVLGFWHEQSRGDRDAHVEIRWENVLPGLENNFLKRTTHWDSYGSSYDLRSVMQYGGYYLSVDERRRPTIINRRTGKPVVAQRNGFSEQDLYQINVKYGCTEYLGNNRNTNATTTSTTTTTTTTTQQTTLSPSQCVDNDIRCKEYSKHHLCEVSNYVRKLCVKTCTKCGAESKTTTEAAATTTTEATTTTTRLTTTKTTTTTTTTRKGQFFDKTCKDQHEDCGTWARYGFCLGRYKMLMEAWCKESCGLCQ